MVDNYTPLDAARLQYPGTTGEDSTSTDEVTIRLSPESEPIKMEEPMLQEQEMKPEQQDTIEQKEVEPPAEPADVSAYVTEKEPEPTIPEDLKKHGLQQVSSATYQAVHLPISDEQVMEGLKQPPTSSYRWLAELANYMLFQSHIKLKQVHGKIIRVFSSTK